jgi:type VI protein secretion system component VasK
MTAIAAPRPRLGFLPFDEEEAVQPRSRTRRRVRVGVAWAVLPMLAVLVLASTLYIAQTAQGTALTYQVASLQAQRTQLVDSQVMLGEQLDQMESAGLVTQAATKLNMASPAHWQVVTPPATTAADPLLPVILALKGA